MPSAGLHYFKGTNSKRKMTWLLRFWVFPWNSTALLSATTHFRSRLGTVLFSCLCKSSLPAFTQTGHNYQALPRSSAGVWTFLWMAVTITCSSSFFCNAHTSKLHHVWEIPKPGAGSAVSFCWKESQDSKNVIIHVVTVYHHERKLI